MAPPRHQRQGGGSVQERSYESLAVERAGVVIERAPAQTHADPARGKPGAAHRARAWGSATPRSVERRTKDDGQWDARMKQMSQSHHRQAIICTRLPREGQTTRKTRQDNVSPLADGACSSPDAGGLSRSRALADHRSTAHRERRDTDEVHERTKTRDKNHARHQPKQKKRKKHAASLAPAPQGRRTSKKRIQSTHA